MENKVSMRNYGIDLFKIICMFLVIGFHYSDHGMTPLTADDPLSVNWLTLGTARMWGGICNGAFMLTTGYFLSMKKQFSWANAFRLYGQVFFYSVACGLVSVLIGTRQFGWGHLAKMVLPFSFNRYWYFSAYLVIYMLHPFLNKLIHSLNRKQLLALCVVCLAIFSGIRTLTAVEWLQGTNRLFIFMTLYFVGASIRIAEIKVKKKVSGLISLALLATEFVSLLVMKYVAHILQKDDLIVYFVWGVEKILPVALSITLFLFFMELNIKRKFVKRFCAFASPALFGVYLIHIGDLHTWLFKQVFDNSALYTDGFILPQMLLAMVCIFCGGILIDHIRILLLEKPLLRLTAGKIRKLDEKTNALLQ